MMILLGDFSTFLFISKVNSILEMGENMKHRLLIPLLLFVIVSIPNLIVDAEDSNHEARLKMYMNWHQGFHGMKSRLSINMKEIHINLKRDQIS